MTIVIIVAILIYSVLRSKLEDARKYTLILSLILLFVSLPFLLFKEVSAADEIISFILLLMTLVLADVGIEELGKK